MSAITRLLKDKKVLLIGGAAVVVLGVSGLALFQDTSKEEAAPQMSASDKKFYAEKDKLKQESLSSVLHNIGNVYAASDLSFPEATEAGWQSVLDTVVINDKFMDPYIADKLYSFTDKTPNYGEIQYGPGMTCAKDRSFTEGYGLNSLALRARFSDGIRCVNNFQG